MDETDTQNETPSEANDQAEPDRMPKDAIPPARSIDFEKPTTDSPLVWWAALVGPALVTLLALGFIYLTQGWEVSASYVGAAATAFFAFGRFVILLGADQPDPDAYFFLKHLNARNLFAMLTWLDVMTAIFVAFHMSVLFRIPWVGTKMEDLVADGRFILERQPWIRQAAFWGLVVFVIFPTSTTGSIGGSIFGRLLGMKRPTIIGAILIGSVLGNGIMLVFAKQINNLVPGGDNIWMKVIGVGVMVFALFLFERRIKSLKRQYMELEAANDKVSE
ncbi:MAG: small multi-drug export protein [Planctomycetota bacterium]